MYSSEIEKFLNKHKREDTRQECNKWKLLLHKSEIKLINKKLANVINEKFKDENIIIVSTLKGGVYFHVDLTRMLTIPYSSYFVEVSTYNDALTQSEEIKVLTEIIPSKFKNKKIILLDELYNNGITLSKTKAFLVEKTGVLPSDVFTCVIFKKEKNASVIPNFNNFIESSDLVGIEIPDVWICGYGIDDWQEKRGWKHLFAVPKYGNILPTNDDKLFTDEEFYNQIRSHILNNI